MNNVFRMLEGEIHFPDAQFWNTEAELITKYVAKDSELDLDPDADLTNEERVQLSAYRRSWYALWVLVIILSLIVWSFVGYWAYRKSKSARNRPYDNILITKQNWSSQILVLFVFSMTRTSPIFMYVPFFSQLITVTWQLLVLCFMHSLLRYSLFLCELAPTGTSET